MPNWCMNTLVLKHDNPSMIKRVEDAFAAGRLLSEFIPNTGDPDDWYSHNITEWGTKWDIGAPDGINDIRDNSIVLYFDSAWSPPTKAYERLQEMGFEIEAMYYEPGIAFCGIWVDGDDEFYDLSNMDVEEVAETIPEELDNTFNITEQMAEWYESDNDS